MFFNRIFSVQGSTILQNNLLGTAITVGTPIAIRSFLVNPYHDHSSSEDGCWSAGVSELLGFFRSDLVGLDGSSVCLPASSLGCVTGGGTGVVILGACGGFLVPLGLLGPGPFPPGLLPGPFAGFLSNNGSGTSAACPKMAVKRQI